MIQTAKDSGKSGSIKIVTLGDSCVHTIPIGASHDFGAAYMKYIIAAGNLFALGSENLSAHTLGLFEMRKNTSLPLCYQIGPFDFVNVEQVCNTQVFDKICRITTNALRNYLHDPMEQHVYLGVCGPMKGSGKVSIFVWVPRFVRSPKEISGVRDEIQVKILELPSPLFGDARLMDGTRPPADKLIRKSVVSAGSSGIVPMMWCSDPSRQNTNDNTPIIPVASYGLLEAAGAKVEQMNYVFSNTLSYCMSALESDFLGEYSKTLRIDKHVETLDTSESELPLQRAAGCRCSGELPTLYDSLPFVVACGFSMAKAATRNVELISLMFQNCRTRGNEQLNAETLLSCLSRDRFDTSTPQSLSCCSDIFDALIASYGTDVEKPNLLAKNKIRDAANRQQCTNFDIGRLIDHHARNREHRPSRTIRLLSHYAFQDSPDNFAQILSGCIWNRFAKASSEKCDIPIAEGLAVYLSLTHHIVPSQNKNAIAMYSFNGVKYVTIDQPKEYLSALLSPTEPTGTLYTLIARFRARINALVGETTLSANENADQAQLSILEKIGETYSTVLEKLSQRTYKNGLVGEILGKMVEEQVSRMRITSRAMDDDQNLTGVKNGVLEVVATSEGRKIFFRGATPDDMISRHINASYNPSVRTADQEFIRRYFSRFIADPETRRWYSCQLAEMFVGVNNKIATFIVGPPDCGKSAHLLDITNFLGPGLAESIPSNVFADAKAGTDTPQPALARAATARMMTVEETSEVIQNNMFKIVVGGTARTTLRTLYKEGSSTSIQGNAFFAMNQNPRFSLYENAIFTRLAIIRPSPRYLDASNPRLQCSEEERERNRTFLKDPNASAVFRQYHDALLLYLMEHFDAWTDEHGRKVSLSQRPPQIMDLIGSVRKQCVYAEFVHENIVASSLGAILEVNEAYERFKTVLAGNSNIPNVAAFKRAISAIIGINPTQISKYSEAWTGHELRREDEPENCLLEGSDESDMDLDSYYSSSDDWEANSEDPDEWLRHE